MQSKKKKNPGRTRCFLKKCFSFNFPTEGDKIVVGVGQLFSDHMARAVLPWHGKNNIPLGAFINCDVERRRSLRRTLSLWTCAWINTFSGAAHLLLLLFIFYSFSFRCVCLFLNYKYVCSSSQLESAAWQHARTDLRATDVPAARREKESLNLSRGETRLSFSYFIFIDTIVVLEHQATGKKKKESYLGTCKEFGNVK